MEDSSIRMLNALAQTIYDKKGSNIIAIDVRGISSLTDYLLIAEGTVDRHVQAIGKAIIDKAEELNLQVFHLNGDVIGDWIVVDCGEMMIHLFLPDMRDKYRLEQVWNKGKIVDLDLRVGSDRE
ncbi:MAG TPA: ribosome silencing factor [Waddliaceae bacterium]